jgi:hypothetical protein
MLPGKSFTMKAAAILRNPVPEIPCNVPCRPFFIYSLSSPWAKWNDRLQNCALSAIEAYSLSTFFALSHSSALEGLEGHKVFHCHHNMHQHQD